MVVRLRLFQLKPNSEITFTPLCVFGFNRKYSQLKNQLHVDYKNTNFSRKSNAALILPSNDFQDSQREKERERESTGGRLAKLQQPRSCCPHRPDHATPLPRSHWPSFLFFLSSSSTSPIWLLSTTNPLHSTPKPNLCTGEFPPLFESDDLTSPPIHTPWPSCHSPSRRRNHTHLQKPTHPLQKPIHIPSNPSSQNPPSNP